jgi:hypothetical protein
MLFPPCRAARTRCLGAGASVRKARALPGVRWHFLGVPDGAHRPVRRYQSSGSRSAGRLEFPRPPHHARGPCSRCSGSAARRSACSLYDKTSTPFIAITLSSFARYRWCVAGRSCYSPSPDSCTTLNSAIVRRVPPGHLRVRLGGGRSGGGGRTDGTLRPRIPVP